MEMKSVPAIQNHASTPPTWQPERKDLHWTDLTHTDTYSTFINQYFAGHRPKMRMTTMLTVMKLCLIFKTCPLYVKVHTFHISESYDKTHLGMKNRSESDDYVIQTHEYGVTGLPLAKYWMSNSIDKQFQYFNRYDCIFALKWFDISRT